MSMRVVIAGILLSSTLAILGAGYVHYNGILKDRSRLQVQVGQLEAIKSTQDSTIEAQGAAIGRWQESQAALIERMNELQRVAREASAETRRLNDLFAEDGRLERLSRQRPGLVEDRINRGSDRAIRLLECASGATGADCPR